LRFVEPEPPEGTERVEVGLREHVRPDDAPVILRPTLPEKVSRLEAVIVDEPVAPTLNITDVGLGVMAKSVTATEIAAKLPIALDQTVLT